MRKFQQKGFGLLQLLVVVAATGLLSSLVILVSGTFQVRTRDARRLSNVNQIRSGLELFYSNAGGYPDLSLWQEGGVIACQGNAIMKVPKDPSLGVFYKYQTGGKAAKACGGKTVWSSYRLQFATESDTSIGPAGVYCLKPQPGIIHGPCS